MTIIQTFSEIESRNPVWLWQNTIPLEGVVIFAGKSCVGKTQFACHVAAHITHGKNFFDETPCPQGSVMILSNNEDNLSWGWKPRLKAAGCQMSRVVCVSSLTESWDSIVTKVNKQTRSPVKFVIIDPLLSYMNIVGGDARIAKEMNELIALSQDHNLTVAGVIHRTKAEVVRGSRVITSMARGTLLFEEYPNNTFKVSPSEMNFATKPTGIVYHTQSVTYKENGESFKTSKIVPIRREPITNETDPLKEAMELLYGLRKENGIIYPSEVEAEAKASRISWKQVTKAKFKLGYRSVKTSGDGPWIWTT